MSHNLVGGRSAYLIALTQRIERKLQRALDSPTQRLELLEELFTDVALEVDPRAQAILFDDNEDVIKPADGIKSSPCFYEVLAEYYVQMPENATPILRLIVQLWSQSFASQIFALLFYKWLFDFSPEKSEGLLRYASAFVQGASNVFWIDVQSNTQRFFSLFHYTFEEVALVPSRSNKIPTQARQNFFMLLSRFFFFYEPVTADRLETLLKSIPFLPNGFLIGGPADFFVIELTDQLQKLKVEPVLLNYLGCVRVLKGMELRMTTSTRLKACLYSFTSPGGPMYPTRAVRHAAWEALDALFPRCISNGESTLGFYTVGVGSFRFVWSYDCSSILWIKAWRRPWNKLGKDLHLDWTYSVVSHVGHHESHSDIVDGGKVISHKDGGERLDRDLHINGGMDHLGEKIGDHGHNTSKQVFAYVFK